MSTTPTTPENPGHEPIPGTPEQPGQAPGQPVPDEEDENGLVDEVTQEPESYTDAPPETDHRQDEVDRDREGDDEGTEDEADEDDDGGDGTGGQ